MKLCLILADAAKKDSTNSVSAIGLGVTRLVLNSVPDRFNGAIVLVATPDQDDVGKDLTFAIQCRPPGLEWTAFAGGTTKSENALDQAVICLRFEMVIERYGEYVFKAECGSETSFTHLVVALASTESSKESQTHG